MRPADTGPPAPTAWSEADLVDLTIRLANDPTTEPTTEPAPPDMGPLTGRVADRGKRRDPLFTALTGHGWSVPLLVTPEVDPRLFGWPAGLVARAPGHPGTAEALTVVEGSL